MNLLLKLSPDVLYLFKFFAFFMAIGVVIILIGIIDYKVTLRKKIRRANENLYNIKYLWLQDAVQSYALHRDNFNYLKTHLIILGQMKFKDKERTSFLTTKFFIRFKRFAMDEVSEFSPESIFT